VDLWSRIKYVAGRHLIKRKTWEIIDASHEDTGSIVFRLCPWFDCIGAGSRIV